MNRSTPQTPKAVHDPLFLLAQGCHILLEWLIPLLDKFPRVRRFTVVVRIDIGLRKYRNILFDLFLIPSR